MPKETAGRHHVDSDLGRMVLGAARDPVIWVFLLAGLFEVLTGEPLFHTIFLFAVAAVLIGDEIGRRWLRRGPEVPGVPTQAPPELGTETRRVPGQTIYMVVAMALYAALVGAFPRYTWPVTVAVGVPAAAVVVWAWRAPPHPQAGRPLHRLGLTLWLSVFVGLGVWELIALILQPSLMTNSFAHPTVSVLLDPVLAHHLGRSVSLAVWLATGWFLVGR